MILELKCMGSCGLPLCCQLKESCPSANNYMTVRISSAPISNSPLCKGGAWGGNKDRQARLTKNSLILTGMLEEFLFEREDPACYPPTPLAKGGEDVAPFNSYLVVLQNRAR